MCFNVYCLLIYNNYFCLFTYLYSYTCLLCISIYYFVVHSQVRPRDPPATWHRRWRPGRRSPWRRRRRRRRRPTTRRRYMKVSIFNWFVISHQSTTVLWAHQKHTSICVNLCIHLLLLSVFYYLYNYTCLLCISILYFDVHSQVRRRDPPATWHPTWRPGPPPRSPWRRGRRRRRRPTTRRR